MSAVSALARTADAVTATVRAAAEATGVDFSYLLAQARLESGLDPAAQARTSSARGLYQFTSGTWLDMVAKHGAEAGLGWAADALKSGAAKAGSAARATILGLRDDAGAAALMAGSLARDNSAALEHRLGHAAGATELYLAHFLGSGGAGHFLSALAADPGQSAARVSPAAARANGHIFYHRDGSARTLAEVYQRFAAKLDPVIPAQAGTQAVVATADSAAYESALGSRLRGNDGVKVAAQTAYALLAELGG